MTCPHLKKNLCRLAFWQVRCCAHRTRRSCQKYDEDFFKFCGLRRKPKLYYHELPSLQYCLCFAFLSNKNSSLQYHSSTPYHLLAMQSMPTLFVLNAFFFLIDSMKNKRQHKNGLLTRIRRHIMCSFSVPFTYQHAYLSQMSQFWSKSFQSHIPTYSKKYLVVLIGKVLKGFFATGRYVSKW